jgi:hypothetical protein
MLKKDYYDNPINGLKFLNCKVDDNIYNLYAWDYEAIIYYDFSIPESSKIKLKDFIVHAERWMNSNLIANKNIITCCPYHKQEFSWIPKLNILEINDKEIILNGDEE